MEHLQAWLDALLATTGADERLIDYLRSTAVSEWMVTSSWAWAISETLHFVGLALLIGIIAPLDVRLMGFMRGVSLIALKELVPWAIVGFVLNLITGVLFFIGAPQQYVGNASWWLKVLFLLIAAANMLWFETSQRSRARALSAGADTPPAFKLIGAVSLMSWLMVLYWGRMLPFAGNAF
jgi:hypothetical protein